MHATDILCQDLLAATIFPGKLKTHFDALCVCYVFVCVCDCIRSPRIAGILILLSLLILKHA